MGIRKLLIAERTDAEWRTRARNSVNQLIDLAEGLAEYELGSGITADRPVTTKIGARYYDTTIDRPIWWNGAHWKNAAGVTV